MFCSNFVVLDTHVKHLRGQDNLTAWGEKETIASGGMMTNYFCKTCGTLMYRIGEKFPVHLPPFKGTPRMLRLYF